jgi:hypothetical protein
MRNKWFALVKVGRVTPCAPQRCKTNPARRGPTLPTIVRRSALIALALLSILNFQLSTVFAQGTAFTYQGRLNTNGTTYSGSAEFQFTLWDAAAGSAVVTNNPASLIVTVTDGCSRRSWI